MVVNCKIEFDNNPLGTYYAGQMLTGKVTIEVDHPKKLKGITLNINGFAHTRWTESHTRTVRRSGKTVTERTSVTYRGHEDYIQTQTFLLGSEAMQPIILEPGLHVYTFACHLPPTCPSSFEDRLGHIRYEIKIILIRPWTFNQSFTNGFTVLRFVDLNYENLNLKMPASSTFVKEFCCFPCKSGPLQTIMNIPQSGYVPGQRIPVSLLVSNESNRPVKQISLELCMFVTFYSQTPTRRSKHRSIVVSKIHLEESVLRHCNKLFNYQLDVPATPPTCVNLCSLIQIEYLVQAELIMPGCTPNQVISMPITIGNVPLMETVAIVEQPSCSYSGMPDLLTATSMEDRQMDDIKSAEAASSAPLAESTEPITYSAPWENNPDIPPPSYEEAIHTQRADMNNGDEHDYGQKEFAPRYPVFSVPSPNPTMTELPQNYDKGT